MSLAMLKDRQKSILNAVVEDYIETAKPVASADLLKKFRFGVSPATVRNDMLALGDLGYLEQPHTSAGRIPTDKGYRFFVDNLAVVFPLTTVEKKLISSAFAVGRCEEFAKELSRAVSRISGAFTGVGLLDEEIFCETGLSELMDEPELMDFHNHLPLGRLIDSLEEEVRALLDRKEIEDAEFFIGEESPFKNAGAYSMVVAQWQHPRGFDGFLAMISPKRTNYSKQKTIINIIKNF